MFSCFTNHVDSIRHAWQQATGVDLSSPGSSVRVHLIYEKSTVDLGGGDQDVVVIVNVLDPVAGSPEAEKLLQTDRVPPLTRSIGSRWNGYQSTKVALAGTLTA